MDNDAILLPGLILSGYTLLFFFYMGYCRYQATTKKEVKIKYYRAYQEGEETGRLRILTRHASNLLEIPMLFYVTLAYISISEIQSTTLVTLAWLFLLARFIHAYIHLSYNNVVHRFFAFGFSLVVLLGMIVITAYQILNSAAG